MLRKLNLRNFRAFRNQSFAFSRINIFVGPNNSGKSSALSALNIIAQTFLSPTNSHSPLILNGEFDNLGTYLDLVHGGRANTPFGIDIGFGVFELKIDFKYRSQRREIEIVKYDLIESGKSILFFQTKKSSFDLKINGQHIESAFPGVKKRRPVFRSFFPYTLPTDLYFQVRKQEKKLGDPIFEHVRKFERSFNLARREFGRAFNDYESLSPFRERPERTYLHSGETATRIGTTGQNTALLLANDASRRGSESKRLEDDISRWFQVTGIAKSIEINSISPRHFEIALVDFDGLKHNIADVGFGCSQVLPVLAATLNTFGPLSVERRWPVLVVQEPEIHLHPNAQAALGSFFVGQMPSTGQLFIETHSDNLILRIARHVAEGVLSANDVKIFYVKKEGGVSVVHNLDIAEDGTFSADWPGGFFAQRQSESLALARASLKRESDPEKQLSFRYPEERV